LMPVPLSSKTALPQRGFTLIELLIVMTLIGIASLLAVSGLDRFALRARDASWTDKVRTELVRHRNKAVLSGSPVRLDVLFASGELRALGDSVSKPRLHLPDSFAFLPAGVAEGYADLSGQQRLSLEFFPDGSASEARFLLRDGDGRLQLFHIRGLTGRITMTSVSAGAELGLTPTLQPYTSALAGGNAPLGGAGLRPPPAPPPGGMGGAGGGFAAPSSQGAGSFK
jgi:general secretion pathway protein H